MPRIPSAPSPKLFAETWAADFKEAVKRAAGKDGRLSVSEAKKLAARPDADKLFADNALNYFQNTGKKSVSIDVLVSDMKALAERAAVTAAGPDGKVSLADGAKLPNEFKEDFFFLRGKSAPAVVTPPGPGTSAMPEVKAALEAATRDLLMPSETDGAFKFMTGQQLNGAPITPALIEAQLGAQHDAQIANIMWVDPSEVALSVRRPIEQRNANDYLDHVINAADPNDPDSLARADRFRQLKAALNDQLTDLTCVRFGDNSLSTFFVGRTRTGELAGLLTGQVET